jgi:hypothetical protein
MATTQPLTDAITALTTYANGVTGASDTTLSDAVRSLADGYGGEEVYTTASGLLYTPIMTIPDSNEAWSSYIGGMFEGATELLEVTIERKPQTGYQFARTFKGCNKLKKITISKCEAMLGGNARTFTGCISLETLTLGSVGNPFKTLDNASNNSSQSSVVINVYVDKETKADAQALGFESKFLITLPNATINYYSSTTGDMLL